MTLVNMLIEVVMPGEKGTAFIVRAYEGIFETSRSYSLSEQSVQREDQFKMYEIARFSEIRTFGIDSPVF